MSAQDRSEQELISKLENASPEEAKNLVVQSIIPQCRGVAKNFFDCIEDKIKVYENKEMDLKQIEREFNDNISPSCMKDFDLEQCLKQYGSGH
jgi:hypothetical protein